MENQPESSQDPSSISCLIGAIAVLIVFFFAFAILFFFLFFGVGVSP